MGSAAVIAIDGPAGAGKSTAARRLAHRLGYVLVDTGALYRAVALASEERGISWDDGAALGRLARDLELELEPGPEGRPIVWIGGRDRSGDIRTPSISRGASDVSRHPEVRDALLDQQRQLGRDGGVVLEGRDIGTVVFPDADLKVFLTASDEVRAARRLEELRARGLEASYEATLSEIRSRDAQDTGRAHAPLRKADDAVLLDTSQLDEDQVLEALLELARPLTRSR
jgi:cytidylate kinase